jgi:glycosyltransferase involved in cell wall biosynthesis
VREVTVLLPTHDHASTLPFALESVQRQSVEDLEILVVGDGVGDDTREVVAKRSAEDDRIRFLDRPKGERNGERHRHQALSAARGRLVCYACDDDLWLPWHVETLRSALGDADFAHTLPLVFDAEGRAGAMLFDATHPGNRACMERHRIGFGLASAGHTLEAYRRLPHGWRPAPLQVASDLYMWRQFMDAGMRIRSLFRPTVLSFGAPYRRGWSAARRAGELADWTHLLRAPDAEQRVAHLALDAAGRRYGASLALRFEVRDWYDAYRAARRGPFWRLPGLLRELSRTFRRYPV